MGLKPSLNPTSTGTQTTDSKIGEAYHTVKAVEEKLTEITTVAEGMATIDTVVENLDDILSVVSAVDDVEAAAALADSKAAQASASAAAAVSAKVDAETAEDGAVAARAAAEAAEAVATTKAGEAATSATSAGNSATTATTQAGISTAQATIATTQAGIATTKAGEAAASATTAGTYATSAGTAKTAAEAARDASISAQNAAENAAGAAENSADNAAADRVQTGLDAEATAEDRTATAADAVATAADRVQTGVDAVATAADRVQTGADVLTTAANRDVSTADKDAAAISAEEAEAAASGAAATKALMDTALAGVTDYSNTLGQLSPAAREIVAAADVVNVFIYDTTLDSDGGAWRKRCNWTSWFKETLNTATRGARNQFPSKALIVARAASVTIYDLDQASCPMWMVFGASAGGANTSWWRSSRNAGSVSALNGRLYFAIDPTNAAGNGGLATVDFVSDRLARFATLTTEGGWSSLGVSSRAVSDILPGANSVFLANIAVNDLAVTVLPGTPIDRRRRLPTPTVAVATAGGVSVIHWDGRVANSADTGSFATVLFSDRYLIARQNSNARIQLHEIAAIAATGFGVHKFFSSSSAPRAYNGSGLVDQRRNRIASARASSPGILHQIMVQPGNPDNSAVADICSTYSTGYMVGNTRLALAESTADLTSLVQGATDHINNTELVTNGDFASGDLTGWTSHDVGTGTTSYESGAMRQTGTDSTNRSRRSAPLTLTTGKRYRLAWTITVNSGSVSVGIAPSAGSGVSVAGVVLSTSGSGSLEFVAAAANYVSSSTNSGGGDVLIDNLSVKEIVTTALYDDFGDYADTAALLAAGWSPRTDSTAVLDTASLKVENTAAVYGYTSRAFATIPGTRYKISGAQVASGGGATSNDFSVGTTAAGGQLLSERAWSSGPHYFVATGALTHVACFVGGNAIGAWKQHDNIRIDVAGSDRSLSGNHPVVFGTISKAAVAAGSEKAALRASSTGGLGLPSSILTSLGTGDFMFYGWLSGDNAGSILYAMNAQDTGGTNRLHLLRNTSSGTAALTIRVPGSSDLTGTTGFKDGVFRHVAFGRSGGQTQLWVDGKLEASAANSGTSVASWTLASLFALLSTASAVDTVGFTQLQIADWRLTAGSVTPQQIRDMYEAEKALFQPNAKCLLPADSVSALAYDDSTDLLHVATTSGMARLKDLLVVDKDAIVVTGIDAKSGIVVTRDANSADAQLPAKYLREELLAGRPVGSYDREKAKGSGVTTNATPTVIGRIPFDKGEMRIADVRVRANQYGDGAAYGRYVRRVLVDRPEEGNIALGGSVETIGTDGEGTSTQDISLAINTTTQTLDITATGLASTNIEWTWEAVLS